ncbi:MAG: hypothetical protein M1541_10230 [Acidobacteria bacterium]|nr:hypothetical protein [Acidobacteriota bacterium]
MLRTIALFLLFAFAAVARGPVYVVLWFDTEDYIEPAADDAALRLAQDLDSLGVRATFKMVGEKARTLEARGRWDVIRALAHHDIGYHTDYHSIPPTPSVYLRELGFLEGAEEFERREGPGFADVRRIFNVVPSCYGQPGSSWGPQSLPALRKMGIGVYLDEGEQVGLDSQPFWYGGLLHVFNMGRFLMRASLDPRVPVEKALAQFDQLANELSARGGGVISTYYHPTEFVTTEFWDGVNFAHGASRERSEWQRPHRRTPEDSERCYQVLRRYVEHAKQVPDVRFVTARELLQLYSSSAAPRVDRRVIGGHLANHETFMMTEQGALSAADMLVALLGLEPQYVDGPVSRRESTFRGAAIPRPAFERARADAASFIRAHHRLPEAVWIGSEELSLADFAATLAGDGGTSGDVAVRKGNLEFEKYFATDPRRPFSWAIHPEGFSAPELLELGKLQGWTLKPARLR